MMTKAISKSMIQIRKTKLTMKKTIYMQQQQLTLDGMQSRSALAVIRNLIVPANSVQGAVCVYQIDFVGGKANDMSKL